MFVADNVGVVRRRALRQDESAQAPGRAAHRAVHDMPAAARPRLPRAVHLQVEERKTVRRVL